MISVLLLVYARCASGSANDADAWEATWLKKPAIIEQIKQQLTSWHVTAAPADFATKILEISTKDQLPAEDKVTQLKTYLNTAGMEQYLTTGDKPPALWSGGSAKSWYAKLSGMCPLENTKLAGALADALGNEKFPTVADKKTLWYQNVGPIFDAASAIFCEKMAPADKAITVYTSQWSRGTTFWRAELPMILANSKIEKIIFKFMQTNLPNPTEAQKSDSQKTKQWLASPNAPYSTLEIPKSASITTTEVEKKIRQHVADNSKLFNQNKFCVVKACVKKSQGPKTHSFSGTVRHKEEAKALFKEFTDPSQFNQAFADTTCESDHDDTDDRTNCACCGPNDNGPETEVRSSMTREGGSHSLIGFALFIWLVCSIAILSYYCKYQSSAHDYEQLL